MGLWEVEAHTFLDNWLTDGSEVVSLMHWPHFTPQWRFLVQWFCHKLDTKTVTIIKINEERPIGQSRTRLSPVLGDFKKREKNWQETEKEKLYWDKHFHPSTCIKTGRGGGGGKIVLWNVISCSPTYFTHVSENPLQSYFTHPWPDIVFACA
jgi:hypothetical protein